MSDPTKPAMGPRPNIDDVLREARQQAALDASIQPAVRAAAREAFAAMPQEKQKTLIRQSKALARARRM